MPAWRNACTWANLDALRDWGHARDYVLMQWRMLQQDITGGFCNRHRRAGIGAPLHRTQPAREVGINRNGREGFRGSRASQCHRHTHRKDRSAYFRRVEVETLLGDPTRAREKLGWTPRILRRHGGRDDRSRPGGSARTRRADVVGPRE